MNMTIRHSRQQWAVGHGFFHTGWIDVGGTSYRYLYDCGSHKDPSLAIQRGDEFFGIECLGGITKPNIDMLVISHFHSDHVNGIPNIFQKFNVKRLVIPYLSLDTQIVALAQFAAEGHATWLEFHKLVTAPRAWADAHNGEGTEIVQVSTGEGSEAGIEARPVTPPVENGFSFGTMHSSGTTHIKHHQTPAAIFSEGFSVWTFQFYTQDIHTLGNTIVNALVTQFSFADKHELLNKLNDETWIRSNWSAIEAYFKGLGSSKQNGTTLCMYSGPERPHFLLKEAYRSFLSCESYFSRRRLNDAVGWIGTGDALLKGANHYQLFENHFAGVIGNTLTVSIPHHGSMHNYHPRLTEIGHAHVITANTGDSKHPAPEIRRHILSTCGNPIVVTEDEKTQFAECFLLKVLI